MPEVVATEAAARGPSIVRILTLSNKPNLLPEAVASVKAQTRQAGLHHVIALDDGSRDWGGRFPPNVWINEQAAAADPEDYLLFLSDDDLLTPNAVADLAGYLDAHPGVMACYGAGEMYLHDPPKKDRHVSRFPADEDQHGKTSLAGRVGSGMVMWRAKTWREVGPFPETGGDMSLSDGAWFTKLAKRFGLYAVHKDVIKTRTTAQSAHTVPNGKGGYKAADWKRLHGPVVPAKPTAALVRPPARVSPPTTVRYDSRKAREGK